MCFNVVYLPDIRTLNAARNCDSMTHGSRKPCATLNENETEYFHTDNIAEP